MVAKDAGVYARPRGALKPSLGHLRSKLAPRLIELGAQLLGSEVELTNLLLETLNAALLRRAAALGVVGALLARLELGVRLGELALVVLGALTALRQLLTERATLLALSLGGLERGARSSKLAGQSVALAGHSAKATLELGAPVVALSLLESARELGALLLEARDLGAQRLCVLTGLTRLREFATKPLVVPLEVLVRALEFGEFGACAGVSLGSLELLADAFEFTARRLELATGFIERPRDAVVA